MTIATRRFAAGSLGGLVALGLIARSWAQPAVVALPEPPSIAASTPQLPERAVQDKALWLMKVIEGDSYAEFAAAITDDFKAAMPAQAFKAMREPLATRLQKGYDLFYMGDLKKKDYTLYVWKIAFRDQKFDGTNINEVMVTFTLKNAGNAGPNPNKIAGFSLE